MKTWAVAVVLLAGCVGQSPEHEGTLGGVRFALRLPPSSHVVREETFPEMRYRRWESAAGLVVVVTYYEPWPDPCRGPNPQEGEGAEEVDGVRRQATFSFGHCLDGARYIRCASWHRRGHLEGDEIAAARATCASFRVLR